MPLQNRVDPFGHIHAVGARGTLMGNRGGCFHRKDRTLRPTHWASRQWIICVLEFRGRKRELMAPGLYTELFFLDEPTALAAGHRPCFECQRERARAFASALSARSGFSGKPSASDLNDAIASEMQGRLKGEYEPSASEAVNLPDGAMFASGDYAWLKLGPAAWRWSFEGYGHAASLPEGQVTVLTPSVTVDALKGGYRPAIHESVNRQGV